jgi:hypothetical protein
MPQEAHMNAEELRRRLALNDQNVVRSAVGAESLSLSGGPGLDAKTGALVRLAALLSLGAATSSCRATVEIARGAGALAIDYDVEDVADACDGP